MAGTRTSLTRQSAVCGLSGTLVGIPTDRAFRMIKLSGVVGTRLREVGPNRRLRHRRDANVVQRYRIGGRGRYRTPRVARKGCYDRRYRNGFRMVRMRSKLTPQPAADPIN